MGFLLGRIENVIKGNEVVSSLLVRHRGNLWTDDVRPQEFDLINPDKSLAISNAAAIGIDGLVRLTNAKGLTPSLVVITRLHQANAFVITMAFFAEAVIDQMNVQETNTKIR
jgi:hypothetical protein